MRILVALGGNALLQRRDTPDAVVEQQHVRRAAAALAPLTAAHELVVCHGNGPQIGLLAVESAADTSLTRPYPLDVLGAQTQGMIGYWLAQELHNAGAAQPTVAVVTQTVVACTDPAFSTPTKFVGATYSQQVATTLTRANGWTFAIDGAGWRRVVASPLPVRVIEEPTIRRLVDAGIVVVCGGGGGAPVVEGEHGRLVGVEAVVDKDRVAALLALALNVDRLILLTDVAAVQRDFGTDHATDLRTVDLDDASALDLPDGSMGPKVEACVRFTTATGRPSAIGALTDVASILRGSAGTTISGSSAQPVRLHAVNGARSGAR